MNNNINYIYNILKEKHDRLLEENMIICKNNMNLILENDKLMNDNELFAQITKELRQQINMYKKDNGDLMNKTYNLEEGSVIFTSSELDKYIEAGREIFFDYIIGKLLVETGRDVKLESWRSQ